LLTPWSRVLLEMLTGFQLVKKLPAFYGSRRFILHYNEISINEMGRACNTHGESKDVYRVLVRKPEGNFPLGRPRSAFVDNIKMDLQEVECGDIDWIELVQDRDRWRTLVNEAMNLRVP